MSRFVLDCAVSRPVDAEIAQWLGMAAQRAWATPAAGYHEAKISEALLQEAVRSMAGAVGASSVAFVADSPTGVSYAISDVALRGHYNAVLSSRADPVVLQQTAATTAAQLGLEHRIVGVDARGRLTQLPGGAVLVTSAVNQEIGTVLGDLDGWAHATESAVILEGSSAFGWIDLPHWDRLILDPRAWGSPAGVVAVASRGSSRAPQFDNVPAAVVAGLACERWLASAQTARESARRHVRRIASGVHALVPGVDIHGGEADDAPHILSLSVLYVDAQALQTRLDAQGYAVGSGSACASRSGQPSHVLAAIGALTSGNVRIGLPPGLPDAAVDGFIAAFATVVAQVRTEMGTAGL